jgi:hypothetical protein
MFKKLNTKTLIILLIALGGIVLANKFYFSKKSESTFRTEFVKIDTGLVNKIIIYPKAEQGKEIKIDKANSGWEVEKEKIKAPADTNAIKGLLASFAEMKSIALAGEDKSSWKDLQVDDSAGTRLKIFTTDNKTYDMVVGKFGYNQQTRNGTTCIRHADEEAVYTVEGFLAYMVNQGFNAWRKKTFISGNKDSWTSINFLYPADSSFTLIKQGAAWTIGGVPTDSAKTEQYLMQVTNMQSAGFADNYLHGPPAVYSLSINGNNIPAPINVQAFPADSTQKYILHSSQNPDAYFSEAQSNIVGRLFVGKQSFLAVTENKK